MGRGRQWQCLCCVFPFDSVAVCVCVCLWADVGVIPSPAPSKPFPIPYSDNFDGYPINSEASYFYDLTGVWEIAQSSDNTHGLVMRQKVRDVMSVGGPYS